MSKYTIKNTEGVQINNQLYVNDSLEFTNNDLEGIIDFVGGAGTIVIDSSIATPFAFAIQDELLNDFLTINGTNGYVKVHKLLEYNSDPTVLSGWGNLSVPTKQYVDSLVGGANQLSEILANGNTSGSNDIYIDNGQKLRTPSIEFDTTVNSDIITNITSDVKFEVFSSSAGATDQYLNMDINNARVNNNVYMDEFETGVNFRDTTFVADKYAMWVASGYTKNASNKHAIIGAVKGFAGAANDPYEIYAEENTNTYTTSTQDTYPVVISGNGITVNAGVTNSVYLGGTNGTVDKNNAAFAQELRFNSNLTDRNITDVNSNIVLSFNDSYNGYDNTFAISTDGIPGSDGGSYLWLSQGTGGLDQEFASIGQGGYDKAGSSELWQTSSQSGGANDAHVILQQWVGDNQSYGIISSWDNTVNPKTSANVYDSSAIWVGGRNNTFNAGVTNSVIVGGTGIAATSGNTLFTQNFETKSLTMKVDDDNNEVSVYNGEKIRKKTPQALVDGATITWDMDQGANANVTLAGNRTLALTNVEAGDYGTIVINQDATGSRTITFGNVNGGAGTHVAVSGGLGSITLTSTGLAVDILSYYYDGTSVHWSAGYDYT